MDTLVGIHNGTAWDTSTEPLKRTYTETLIETTTETHSEHALTRNTRRGNTLLEIESWCGLIEKMEGRNKKERNKKKRKIFRGIVQTVQFQQNFSCSIQSSLSAHSNKTKQKKRNSAIVKRRTQEEIEQHMHALLISRSSREMDGSRPSTGLDRFECIVPRVIS